MSGRPQVTDCGAHPGAAVDVERQRSDAGGSGSVVVRAMGEAGVPAGLVESVLLGPPLVVRESRAGYWPRRAVELIPEVSVTFEFDHVGQDSAECPLVVAPLCPEVEVFRHGPEELGIVDRAGAARDLASRYVNCGLVGCAGAKVPDVSSIPNCGVRAESVPDLLRNLPGSG